MKPKNYPFSINKSSACLANSQLGLTLLALLFAGHLMAQTPQLVSTDALNPKYLTEYNDQLFFSADDTNGKNWLWSTDGTTTTMRSYSATANFPGTQPRNLIVLNNQLILTSVLKEGSSYNRELFEFDGTGPILLKNINPDGESEPEGFTEFNGKLYFSADDGTNGRELWVTNGTDSGTQLLKDINSGSDDSYPMYFTKFNGKLFFSAYDNTHERELWVTDGTQNGTQLVKNIDPSGSGNPRNFKVYNGKLYFNGIDGINGSEVWVCDGTSTGTHLFKDLNPGHYSSFPKNFAVYNGKLFFSTILNGSAPFGLWISDGTTAGTNLFKNIYNSKYFTEYNGKLYFGAIEGNNNKGLWITDGIAANTVKLKSVSESLAFSFTYDDRLYFTAGDGTNGRQLWVSDGTTPGTETIIPAVAPNYDPISSSTFEHLVVDGTLYYTADYDGNGVVLWKLTTNNLSAKDHIENEFTVYPNPVQDVLYIEVKSGTIQKIDLFSTTGQRLKSWKGKSEINMAQFASGSYFVKVTAQDGKTVVKQVVKK